MSKARLRRKIKELVTGEPDGDYIEKILYHNPVTGQTEVLWENPVKSESHEQNTPEATDQ
ncbi:MAG TPA: hypothetical protein PKM59_10025 [Thermodesulfobacteriota bacterium]|nr:hypothetical protein [Thermodesulfobacteriota bacterium]